MALERPDGADSGRRLSAETLGLEINGNLSVRPNFVVPLGVRHLLRTKTFQIAMRK